MAPTMYPLCQSMPSLPTAHGLSCLSAWQRSFLCNLPFHRVYVFSLISRSRFFVIAVLLLRRFMERTWARRAHRLEQHNLSETESFNAKPSFFVLRGTEAPVVVVRAEYVIDSPWSFLREFHPWQVPMICMNSSDLTRIHGAIKSDFQSPCSSRTTLEKKSRRLIVMVIPFSGSGQSHGRRSVQERGWEMISQILD